MSRRVTELLLWPEVVGAMLCKLGLARSASQDCHA